MSGDDELVVHRTAHFSLAQFPTSVAFYNPPAANKIMERLTQELGAGDVKALIVDLKKIENCGSQLLTLLVHLHIRAKKLDKSLRVCAVKPFVLNAIQTMGLNTIFPVYSTREEAMNA